MNVFSFVQWNKYFHSANENICTIALINIHYLYNICFLRKSVNVMLMCALRSRNWFYIPISAAAVHKDSVNAVILALF